MKSLNLIALFAALAACTPETTTPVEVDPPKVIPDPIALGSNTQYKGLVSTGLVTSSHAENELIQVTLDGHFVSARRNSALDGSGFLAAASQASFFPALVNSSAIISQESESGNTLVSLVALGSSTPPNDGEGARVTRLEGANLPQAGTASFEGGYAGVYNTSFISIIYGDATLTADFENATIDGVISNRREITATGGPWTPYLDIVLAPSDIDATGAFSGAVSGGAVDGTGTTTAGGTYTGLIGGTTGNEVAGALEISTTFGTLNINETGVFLAEQTDP